MDTWKSIYINGIDTGYKVSDNGLIMNPLGNLNPNYDIEFNNSTFKMDKDMLIAYFFIENNNEYENIQNDGSIHWFLDKQLLHDSIEIEKEYFENNIKNESIDKACELMQNPMMRLNYVSYISGIHQKDLYYTWIGKKNNEISKKYVFPIRNYRNNTQYNDNQIHEVCSMLSSKNIHPNLINRMTGVDLYTIKNIHTRRSCELISMFYEFFPTNKFDVYTRQQILQACIMLEDGIYDYGYISKFCNMDIKTLISIRDGKKYRYISKDFNLTPCTSIAYSNEIIQMLNKGFSTNEIIGIIQVKYGVPNRMTVLSQINEVKNKYFNVTGSTTIHSLE